jgi:methyl-accepting chemotaxis protein
MQLLDNIKMGPKLIASFAITAAITVIVGAFGAFKLGSSAESNTMMHQKLIIPMAQLADLMEINQKIMVNLRDSYVSDDVDTFKGNYDQLLQDRAKLEAQFGPSLVTDEGRRVWAEYTAARAKCEAMDAKVFAHLKAGRKAQGADLMFGEAYQAMLDLEKVAEKLKVGKLGVAQRTADANAETAAFTIRLLVVLMLLGAMVGIVLGVIIARSITLPLKKGVEMMGELSLGHLSLRLGQDRQDEIGELARSMDAFAGNLQRVMVGLQEIAAGNLAREWTCADDRDEIAPALILVRQNLLNLVEDAAMLGRAGVEGRLATRADATKHQGDYRKIVQGFNDCLDTVIGPLKVTADYVDKCSKGIIPPVITDNYNGDFNEIKNNLNTMVTMMSDLLSETDKIIKAAADGQLDTRADASKFVGGWNKLVSGVNDTITNIVNPLNVTADYVDKVAKGIIPPAITTEYKGQYNVIKGNLNSMVAMMSDLLTETDALVQAAINGRLATRAQATKFVGGWFHLVDGVNKTLDAVIVPLNVSAGYVDRISKGDIPPLITDNYNGDLVFPQI